MSDPLATRIHEMIEPSVEGLGFELVRVRITGSNSTTLQIMADRADGSEISVEDCATISRNISPILDVEDPISGEYSLEVSSPGIDRPLTRPKDFDKWAGFDLKLETRMMVGDRKRFRGRLLGISDDQEVVVELDDGENFIVAFGDIASAKLLLTDELIKATSEARQAAQG